MLDRLPKLKLIAVSRGGPVNIDMRRRRRAACASSNTPGRNASAVAEFTIGAILAETRLITRGMNRCGAANGAAIFTVPISPGRNCLN